MIFFFFFTLGGLEPKDNAIKYISAVSKITREMKFAGITVEEHG